MSADQMRAEIAAVIIGRNEGARLLRCLESVSGLERVVYVDSGSTDGSIEAATSAEAEVVNLDITQPFTAARARNAGIEALRTGTQPEFIQFIDGDCELQPDWLSRAHAFLHETPQAAIACGRRRERFPASSVYNSLCDDEWNTPIGKARACGGDALIRMSALDDVSGYNPALIAGEEPEMCVRLRALGWEIWRLDHEMTLHDANMTRFGQWWKRARRAGHAVAEGMALHGGPPERHGVRATRSALIWGVAIPLVTLLALMISKWGLALLLIWPAQVLRLRLRGETWVRAFFLTLSKIPEALGALEYGWNRLRGKRTALIEHK